MSGVRFVSVIVAVVFTLLWGGIVVHSWQKNREARQIAYAESVKAERVKAEQAEAKRLEAEVQRKAEIAKQKADELKAAALKAEKQKAMERKLAHADALANAASEEFNKHTKDGKSAENIPLPIRRDSEEAVLIAEAKNAEPGKDAVAALVKTPEDDSNKDVEIAGVEKDADKKSVDAQADAKQKVSPEIAQKITKPELEKPVWAIADAKSPDYDDGTVIKVREFVWQVPTGNDPYYASRVGSKIAKIATKIKGDAVVAADVVGDKLATLADDVKEKIVGKTGWVVPTGATPDYAGRPDDNALAQWQVPDANEPDYDASKIVVAKIEDRLSDIIPRKKNDIQKLKNKRTALAEVKKEIMTDVVDERDETDNIEGSGITEVTGNSRAVGEDLLREFSSREDRETLANDDVVVIGKDTARLSKDLKSVPVRKYAWSVPDGVTPVYDERVVALADTKTQKPLKTEKETGKLVPLNKPADVEVAKTVIAKDVTAKVATAKDDTDEDLTVKDGAAKDEVAKVGAVAKVESAAKDDDQPKSEVKLADANRPIWVVPTGKQPLYSVVTQLERGLDKVTGVAAVAGSEIAEKVVALGDNVKEAIASPKKWEVPTGVTPGEDTVVAAIEPKVLKAEEKQLETTVPDTKVAPLTKLAPETKTPESKSIVEQPLKKPDVADEPAQKVVADKEPENEVVFSAKMQDMPGDEKIAALDVDDAATVKGAGEKSIEDKVEKTVEKTVGLVTRIIKMIADPDNKDKKTDLTNDPYHISRTDKVRFEAIKNLMIDQVAYDFMNVEKGEGKISISGRSQADAKLSFYVGPRYLGDAEADSLGKWNFTRELFIPQGKHIIQAQQMSDSGLSLARKTFPLTQMKAAKAPEGYDGGIGIELGDKALAILQSKMKKDEGLMLANGADKITESEPEVSVATSLPLPLKKPETEDEVEPESDVKTASKEKIVKKEIQIAAVTTSIAIPIKKPLIVDPVKKAPIENTALVKNELVKSGLIKTGKSEDGADEIEKAGGADISSEADDIETASQEEKATGQKVAAVDAQALNKKMTDDVKAEGAKAEDAKEVSEKATKAADAADGKEAAAKIVEQATLQDEAPRYYVVKPGDTLGKIAKETLGDPLKYKLILELNPKLKSANLIYPKQKLLVAGKAETADAKVQPVKVAALAKTPVKDGVKEQAKAAKVDSKTESKKAKAETKTRTKAQTGGDYVVQQGDSLWKIAVKIYGNGQKFSELIKLNPKLKNNPGAIYPNLKLKVKAG